MGRTSLFLFVFVTLPVFACDAGQEVDDSSFRSHKGHHKNHGHHGHHGKHKKNRHTYPGSDWQTGVPEQHGLSSEGLANALAVAEHHESSCMVVIHDGELVGEWYGDGYDADTPIPDVWSVTKSVTSAAIGVADAEGLLDIHDPVADYVPQWRGGPSEQVKIFDLLTHTSGREWNFFSDFEIFETVNQTEYSLSFGQSREPGTRWDYSNLGTQTLEAVLEAATGGDVEAYYQEKIFEPIGMEAQLARDPSGNPRMYTGLSATCRDMARFGYLYLRNGRWDGRRVVPKGWVRESTEPSTDLNDAYGYLWWLNEPGHVIMPSTPERVEYEGQMFPSAPDDMFIALGAFGQFAAVIPSEEMVVVRFTDVLNYDDPLAMGTMDDILGAVMDAKLEDDGCN